jgi:hypothetical protein
MILNFLSFHYNIFVKTLTSKKPLPTLEELKFCLLIKEVQIKPSVEKETFNDALVIQSMMNKFKS